MNTRLNPSNRLRASTAFIEASNDMSKYATVKHPWNKTHNTPSFTGITPHVIIMVEMENLKSVLIKHRQVIVVDFW